MSLKLYSILLLVSCAKPLQVIGSWTPPPTDSTNLDTTAEACIASTAEEDPDTLLMVGNDKINLFAIYNVTGKAGVVMDLNNSLIAVVNGTSPRSVIIDIKTRKGFYVTSDNVKFKTSTIRDWISSAKDGLKPYLSQETVTELEVVTEFELDNAPPLILEEIKSMLEKLIIGISKELENNPKEGLGLFEAVGSEIFRLKQGVLYGSVQVLGIKGACMHADLAGTYNTIKGLALVIARIPGGIPAILEAGGTIQYPNIANGRNGLEALAELIRGMGRDKKIGHILGDILNDPETLLRVVDLLCGSTNIGLAGVLKVAAAAAQFANKEKSLEYTINVMLQFLAANSQNDIDSEVISSQLKESITILLEAIDEVQLSATLSGAIEVLRSLEEGNLQINKVKISLLLSILISAINQPKELQTIVKVLIELREVIDIEESIVRLMIVLILNVNSPLGIELLERCGVPVDINTGEISGSILENILKSISDLISRLSHDLYEGLCTIPALDKIVDAINTSISECGVDKNLKDILSANEVAKNLIKAVLQVVGKLRLEVPEDICSMVGETVETCSRVNFYLHIDANVTITK